MLYVGPDGMQTETTLDALLSESNYTVLYFYPKDNTPGCTIEARDFTKLQKDFLKHHTQILGVSKDSVKSHCKFQEKQELSLGLISDEDTTLAQKFGAR
jgi:peroxiredoxin Q/BCP